MDVSLEFPTSVAEKLREAITDGTLEKELTQAIAYVTKLVADEPEMLKPLGLASRILSPKQMQTALQEQMANGNKSPSVHFAGALGMLDLTQLSVYFGVCAHMDLPKLRLACDELKDCADIAKVLDKVNIQADVIGDALTRLVSIDNAPEIQAVILAMYWNQDPNCLYSIEETQQKSDNACPDCRARP